MHGEMCNRVKRNKHLRAIVLKHLPARRRLRSKVARQFEHFSACAADFQHKGRLWQICIVCAKDLRSLSGFSVCGTCEADMLRKAGTTIVRAKSPEARSSSDFQCIYFHLWNNWMTPAVELGCPSQGMAECKCITCTPASGLDIQHESLLKLSKHAGRGFHETCVKEKSMQVWARAWSTKGDISLHG